MPILKYALGLRKRGGVILLYQEIFTPVLYLLTEKLLIADF